MLEDDLDRVAALLDDALTILRNARGAGGDESGLAPLNFRVDASFRREFKTYAARHDLKLNELLRRSFESYRRQNGD